MDGRSVTAIDIQQSYLSLAEEHLERAFMPSWAPVVCREWRAMLARLVDAPTSVDRTLDWAIKWSLYDRKVRDRSLGWERFAVWQPIVTRLKAALERVDATPQHMPIEVVLGHHSPIPNDVQLLTRVVRDRGLEWSELVELTALRHELFEVETRFSELDKRGIFASLDRAGVLDHRVDGVDAIDQAVLHPPERGRAHSRGSAVQRLAGRVGWSCDWSGVWNTGRDVRALDLSDPFIRQEEPELDRLGSPSPATTARPSRRQATGDSELTAFMEYLHRRN